MKKLLNTLYITSEDKYLSLDGENVVVSVKGKEVGRVPLHNLEAIVTFGFAGASPALMGGCAQRNVALTFLSPYGKYLASVVGKTRGNVVLRKKQYQVASEERASLAIAKNCIMGKVYNCRWILERSKRDHPLQVDVEQLKNASQKMQDALLQISITDDIEELRGREGAAATVYFSVFHNFILQQKDSFEFRTRSRRPPLDRVNALLSFSYTLLTSMVTSALETVGLDPAVGFMHGDRPGRNSLALDMMEELRPVLADRFVVMLINKRIVTANDFSEKEDGAVLLTEEARKMVLSEWQKRKQIEITHPFLNEKVAWGLVPYIQAMLLSRYLRGDIEEYPPFFWR
ncbi:MAG: type I-C CRISPR-associated endonuclease Cas1c [Lachnospiraceae bacterium]|nr:type I-C CRISPR-associated endonuclease Cas1c [Lachnospiraceae bacterium]